MSPCNLSLECINSGESGYDFGIISNINQSLSLTNTEDSQVKKSFSREHSTTAVKIVDFGHLNIGIYFIDVKYIKDGSVDSGNDSLQFKVKFSI